MVAPSGLCGAPQRPRPDCYPHCGCTSRLTIVGRISANTSGRGSEHGHKAVGAAQDTSPGEEQGQTPETAAMRTMSCAEAPYVQAMLPRPVLADDPTRQCKRPPPNWGRHGQPRWARAVCPSSFVRATEVFGRAAAASAGHSCIDGPGSSHVWRQRNATDEFKRQGCCSRWCCGYRVGRCRTALAIAQPGGATHPCPPSSCRAARLAPSYGAAALHSSCGAQARDRGNFCGGAAATVHH